jgi:hypothetical protein
VGLTNSHRKKEHPVRNVIQGLGLGLILWNDIRSRRQVMCGLAAFGSGYGPLAGSCEHNNEPSDSIKGGEFLYWL